MQTSKNIKHEMLENWASKKQVSRLLKSTPGTESRRRAISDEHAMHSSLITRTHGGGAAGGASRDRTGDLLLAKQALSQLSYGP